MKKILAVIGAVAGVFFISASAALAVGAYLTAQGGTGTTSPSGILYGDNGATSHLSTVVVGSGLSFSGGTLSATGGGGSGNVATSTHESAGQISYWTSNSGTPATLGQIATTSASLGLGLSGALTTINNTAQSLSIATSSLYTGTIGQVAYFNGTNALAGTSNIFLSGSNIGIGTTSPQGKLEVNSNNQDTYLTSYSSAGYSRLFLYNNANTGIVPLVYGSAFGGTSSWGYPNANLAALTTNTSNAFILGTTANQPLSFITSNAQRLTILGNGKVGIGTTSPAATLGISQSTAGDRLFELYDTWGSPSKSVALIYRNNNVVGSGSTSNALLRLVDNASNYPLSVESSAGASLFAVQGNGNVGISSSSPYAQLSVNTVAGQPAVVVGSTTTQFIIDPFGNVGIGTTSPYASLSLGGGNLVLGAASAGGTPGDLYLPKLGVSSGSFIAVDASGKIIATTSPLSTLVANYPITGNGTSGSPLSLAFGTTTANTWSGLQTFTNVGTTTFSGGLQAVTGFFSGVLEVVGRLIGMDTTNNWRGVVSPTRSFVLATGTTTTWTASTTGSAYSPVLVMPFTGTLRDVRCTTDQSFLGVNVQVNGSNATPSYFVSSSTVGTVAFTAGNTFTAGQKILANFGTTTTASTLSDSCTFEVTETP